VSEYVVLLGTKGGPAIRQGSTMPTSNLVVMNGRQIVVDCGLGVTRALTNHGFALKDLELIFITHLHSDHYLELGPLIHTAWTAGLKTSVDIWGPAGLQEYWDNFVIAMRDDIDIRITDEGRPDLRALVRFHQLDEGSIKASKDIEIRALRVAHPPLTDCFSLSFQSPLHRVVFSADTTYFPPLAEFAKGADLLVHEAMLEAALEPLLKRVGNGDDRLMHHWLRSHTLASDAAKMATSAGVKALAFTHLIPSDDPDFGEAEWREAVDPYWDGAFHLGTDGLVIELI